MTAAHALVAAVCLLAGVACTAVSILAAERDAEDAWFGRRFFWWCLPTFALASATMYLLATVLP